MNNLKAISTPLLRPIFNNGVRTWAIYPPIDIDLKHPDDKRNIFQRHTLPFNTINPNSDYTEKNTEDIIRDASGLKPHLKRKLFMHKTIPPLSWQLRRNYNCSLYANFGQISNVNPSICWPTSKEVVQKIEVEKEWEKPLSKLLNELYNEKQEMKEKNKIRLEKITLNMAKMDKMIKDFKDKNKTDLETQLTSKKKKDNELLEDAREYFGYRISASDPKYKTFIGEREVHRKKAQRLAKKQDKETKKIAAFTDKT
ncbi:uncharacterized protein LOC135923756 isoform X2 [Gordionus sp. m RMFG-2023]|uniref:uncharacterized protein LOC135923756 isoform X2 n=1 Tax=Gordionus sp. m RMFG-2023 TaxID=3053472 RepID=UPI0031FC220C